MIPWTIPTPENLEALAARYSGHAGDEDAESILTWTKSDSEAVEFTSTRGADVARLIRRCGSAVLGYLDLGESVTIRIAKTDREGHRVYRGMEYAFSPIDVESKPWGGNHEAG